jgi:cytochrome c556
MNRSLIIALGVLSLSMTTLLSSGYAADPRQHVELPPMMQEHMLGNMRDHLLAISEIQTALAAGKYEQAADIAEQRIGMSSLQIHGASHMAPYMPKSMQAIGTEMHRAASRFAIAATNAATRNDIKPALAQLAHVTQQCVACHSSYRIK